MDKETLFWLRTTVGAEFEPLEQALLAHEVDGVVELSLDKQRSATVQDPEGRKNLLGMLAIACYHAAQEHSLNAERYRQSPARRIGYMIRARKASEFLSAMEWYVAEFEKAGGRQEELAAELNATPGLVRAAYTNFE